MRDKTSMLIVVLAFVGAAVGGACRRPVVPARGRDLVSGGMAGASTDGIEMSRPAGPPPLHPVRMTPLAPIGQGQDVGGALKQRFKDVWDVQVGKSHARKRLKNCHDYLALGTDDIQTEEPADLPVFLNQASACQALHWLQQARPSSRSFLDGFRLDSEATQALPARFYLDLAPDEEAALVAATQKGQSWQSFDPDVHAAAVVDAGTPAHFIGRGYDAYVREYARGDFNHDGIEDVLIARLAYPDGGSMTDYTLFLLTRTSDTGDMGKAALGILKIWRQAS